ncbi:MAG: LamG domain-containing protein, partial [Planctomycetes bacterium]|nr:LamG domain-containing protein [Planctomycetota bacterium]
MPEGLGNLIGDKFKQAKVQTETQGLNPGTSSSLFVFADYSIRVNVTRVLVESRSITGAMIWGLDTWGSPTTWGGSKGSYSTVEDITLSQTIPTIAREEIAKWLAAESADDPDYGALGTGNTDISAHYLLNDNSLSTTVIDSKGLYNGVSNANTSTMTVSGQINNALEFNGTTDFITISANEPISQTEGTIALWVKFNAIGKDQIIFISGESAADGETGSEDELFIKLNGATDKIEAGWRTANELDIAVSNDAVSTGSFIHVMLRWSLSEYQVRLFIANVEQDTGDVFTNDNKDNWVDEMRIGRSMGSAANNNYLDGVLDDIRIYPTALSVTERGEVYNSGSGTETGGLGDPAPYTDGDTAL